MTRATRFGKGCLALGALLAIAGLALVASPWYVDGGLVARFYGYAPAPGESNWLSVLSGTAASFVAGGLTFVAGLVLAALGTGGLLAASRHDPRAGTSTERLPADRT